LPISALPSIGPLLFFTGLNFDILIVSSLENTLLLSRREKGISSQSAFCLQNFGMIINRNRISYVKNKIGGTSQMNKKRQSKK